MLLGVQFFGATKFSQLTKSVVRRRISVCAQTYSTLHFGPPVHFTLCVRFIFARDWERGAVCVYVYVLCGAR